MHSNQLSSIACPPCPSDDSIFFNLILGTAYENTKENCLIFLKNYSKQIFYSKREIFKIVINELTLNEYSDNRIGNAESIYLIRQLIKKYTKNNIINALYEFISEKDNEMPPNVDDKNNMNLSDNFSFNKIESEEESKNENDKFKSIQKKEKNNEKKEENVKNKDYMKDNNNISNEGININFLEKKRKITSPVKDTKKTKKVYSFQNSTIQNSINNNNNENLGNEKDKEENKAIKKEKKDEEKEEGLFNENNEEKICQKEKNGNKNEKKEETEKNAIKEKIKIKIFEKNKIKEGEDKKEKEKIKQQLENYLEEKKKKENNEKGEIIKDVRLRHENKLKSMPFNKNYISLISNIDNRPNKTKINKKRSYLIEEVIKLESSEEIVINNNMNIYPNNSIETKSINSIINNQPPLDYNLTDSQEDNSSENQIKDYKFRNHLIKYCDRDGNISIYSYKLKRIGGENNKLAFFVCNNKRCRGKGEYDMEKQIFRETVKHSMPISLHKMSSIYFDIKDNLLNDHDCIGYQVLNDYNFIKDKIVIIIN